VFSDLLGLSRAFFGGKPTPGDPEGDFNIQVAQDMQMIVSGARYYFRLAAKYEKHETEEDGLRFQREVGLRGGKGPPQ
jgi:hypothetical protein